LFGVKPDALAGEIKITPGFPKEWMHAKLMHPDIRLQFDRDGMTERWVVGRDEARFRTARLRLTRTHGDIASIEVNGTQSRWTSDEDSIEIVLPATRESTIAIRWTGQAMPLARLNDKPLEPSTSKLSFDWRASRAGAHFDTVDLSGNFNDRVTEIFKRGKYQSPRSPFVSLAIPAQGIGAWAGHVATLPEINDSGLRKVASDNGGRLTMPNGVPFAMPGMGDARNIVFTSQWDNYPREATIALIGKANHVYLLMAGSTNHMQSRIDNGDVIVTYADGTTARLALHNPMNWWPIDQDYFIDDYQFKRPGPIPPRVNLRTGEIRLIEEQSFKGRGGNVSGGAATALDLPLDATKELKSLTVRTIANEVVIGVMGITLERP
jgi:hypothetical protein